MCCFLVLLLLIKLLPLLFVVGDVDSDDDIGAAADTAVGRWNPSSNEIVDSYDEQSVKQGCE